VLRQRGAGILIEVAHPAGMREHGEGRGGRAGWGHCRSGVGNSRLRLLQSRSICHFGTERPKFRDRCKDTLRRNRVSTGLTLAAGDNLEGTGEGNGLNRIVHGDNLEALRGMTSGSVAYAATGRSW
jgi:hypothetical protein